MRIRILSTLSLGLVAAACQAPYNQTSNSATAPAYSNRQASTQACVDYGFNPGSASYDRCVSREQAARAAGRVTRDYTPTLLTADARNACASYGLVVGTPGYDRCVGREVEARTYRDGTTTTTSTTTYYSADANGNRIDAQGYPIDSNGVRLARPATYPAAQPSYPAQYPTPSYPASATYPAGQAVQAQPSRDEFGQRYDAQGNRIDASGRVINRD